MALVGYLQNPSGHKLRPLLMTIDYLCMNGTPWTHWYVALLKINGAL